MLTYCFLQFANIWRSGNKWEGRVVNIRRSRSHDHLKGHMRSSTEGQGQMPTYKVNTSKQTVWCCAVTVQFVYDVYIICTFVVLNPRSIVCRPDVLFLSYSKLLRAVWLCTRDHKPGTQTLTNTQCRAGKGNRGGGCWPMVFCNLPITSRLTTKQAFTHWQTHNAGREKEHFEHFEHFLLDYHFRPNIA